MRRWDQINSYNVKQAIKTITIGCISLGYQTRLFVQKFVQANHKETSKLCIAAGPLWGELLDSPHKGPVDSPHKWPVMCFPVITSSCLLAVCPVWSSRHWVNGAPSHPEFQVSTAYHNTLYCQCSATPHTPSPNTTEAQPWETRSNDYEGCSLKWDLSGQELALNKADFWFFFL